MVGILQLTNFNSVPNLQIPSINIKLDRDNYSLWRTTIISALETFELENHVLNSSPQPKVRVVPATENQAATT